MNHRCPKCESEEWDRITDHSAPGASFNRCYWCENEWHMNIVTNYVHPPIPLRSWDWVAFWEGEEELGRRGYGATEEEAIADLVEQEYAA